jgi:hypothetical protein
MKCPTCNKFAAYDSSTEPEVELDIEAETGDEGDDGVTGTNAAEVHVSVTGTVRIVLTAACCDDELKDATFDLEMEADIKRADGCTCDLTAMNCNEENFSMEEMRKKGKVHYKAIGSVAAACACGKTINTWDWEDEIAASEMEELV